MHGPPLCWVISLPVAKLDTNSKFYIDLDWWQKQGRDFREQLYEELCDECKRLYPIEERREVDRIDPVTGEVTRWDALWECVMDACGASPDFVSPKMPLTRAIFRALIANGNQPLSAAELFTRINKASPQVILKELLSPRMEMEGITPIEAQG